MRNLLNHGVHMWIFLVCSISINLFVIIVIVVVVIIIIFFSCGLLGSYILYDADAFLLFAHNILADQ